MRSNIPMGPGANWIEVSPKGAQTCIVIYPRAMMPDRAQRKPSMIFTCDDIQKTYCERSARGVKFTQAPKDMPWGPFDIFQDPDANDLMLRQGQ